MAFKLHDKGVSTAAMQRLTANLEELHEVVKLAVDISADSDGAVDSLRSNTIRDGLSWFGCKRKHNLGDSYWVVGSPAHCSPWTGFPWLSRRALSPGSI